MTKDKALELAQELKELANRFSEGWHDGIKIDASDIMLLSTAAEAIEQAQKPEGHQEPVAFINVEERKLEWAKYMSWDTPTVVNLPKIPLYTTPPQRQPLTDEEIQKCYETTGHYQTLRPQDRFAVFALARAIEAAHGVTGEA